MDHKYYAEVKGNSRKISVLLPQEHKEAIGEGKNIDFGFFSEKTKQLKIMQFHFAVNEESGNSVLSFELHRLQTDGNLIEGLIKAALELLIKD